MRRLILICFILCFMLLNTFSLAFSVVDMPTGWSQEAVDKAINNGILSVENGYVRPQEMLTRAEMASGIVNAFGAFERADLNEYTDISPENSYYDVMSKAVAMGVISGYGNGRLEAEETISREELFAVIYNALGLEDGNLNYLNRFNDKDLISDWSKGIVARMIENNYISGNSKGNIKAKDNITREEFAQIMKNIFDEYYTTPGTYAKIPNGNIVVNSSGVILKDCIITGDLIIADGVGNGTVTLDNIIVYGKMIIRDSRTSISLLNGSELISDVVVVKSEEYIEEIQKENTVKIVSLDEFLNKINSILQNNITNIEKEENKPVGNDNSHEQNVAETGVKTLTLTYNLSGGFGRIESSNYGLKEDEISCEFTISDVEPVKLGYKFVGWSDEKNATDASYVAGNKIVISRNKTLYAVWQEQ